MTDIPDGWTDDMNIPLPNGVTVERIGEFVLSSAAAGESHEVRIAALLSWGLTRDDAELACDRALGGAFRANELSTLAGALAGTVLTVHLYRRQGPDWNHRRSRLLRRLQE